MTWLPNQLMAVMDAMVKVWDAFDGKGLGKEVEDVMEALLVQKATLEKEVEKYCQERGVQVK